MEEYSLWLSKKPRKLREFFLLLCGQWSAWHGIQLGCGSTICSYLLHRYASLSLVCQLSLVTCWSTMTESVHLRVCSKTEELLVEIVVTCYVQMTG